TSPGGKVADKCVRVTAQAKKVDEIVRVRPLGALADERVGQVQCRGDQAGPAAGFQRHENRLADGQFREERGCLEGPAESGPGPCGRGGPRDILPQEPDSALRGSETADG